MKGKLMIMLLLVGSILFGAPVQQSATLHLRCTIDRVHEVKILGEVPANVGAFNRASTITDHEFTESKTTVKYYMVVKTNNKSAVNIDVAVKNMKSTGISTQIAYTISTKSISITSTGTGATGTLFKEALVKNDMRLVSQPFTITLDSSSMNNAIPATYTSNITFNLMAP